MVKALAFALVVALLSACASARVTPSVPDPNKIPFATVKDLPEGNGSFAQCPDGTAVTVARMSDNRYLLLVVMPRFILIDFTADRAWVGVMQDTTFVVKQTLPLADVKAKYPSPCQYLVPGIEA